MQIENIKNSCNFGTGSAGSLFLGDGWEYPEFWGCKNSDVLSKLKLPLIYDSGSNRVSVSIWCLCESETYIWINRVCIAVWLPQHNFSLRTIECTGSAPENDTKYLLIEFETKFVKSLSLASLWIQGCTFIKNRQSKHIGLDIPANTTSLAPLFITGIPRSGTSITYKVVSEALNFNNPTLIESFFFNWAFTKFKSNFVGDCANAFLGNELARDFDKFRTENFNNPDYDDTLMLARYYYRLATMNYGSLRVIDKTPGHLFYWRSILAAFPKAKIIFCMRSALDIYASFKKRLQDTTAREPNADEQNWLSIDLHTFSLDYESSIDVARSMMICKESVLMVQYDKLISKDPELLSDLSKFIDCSPALVNLALDVPSIPNSQTATALRGGAVVMNNIDFKRYLSDREIAMLSDLRGI